MSRTPRHVSAFLVDLAGQLPALLGRNLVGIYVYGSLTQRAFDPERSDLDCIAVIRRDLRPAEARTLRRYLARASKSDPWARRLQLSVLVKRSLLKACRSGWLHQFGRFRRTGSDGNPIVWMNVLASGRALCGPPADAFVPEITPTMLRAALKREVGYLHTELFDKRNSRWRDIPSYRVYAVLTLCRILYSLHTGEIASKPRAARWALRSVPMVYHPIIREALDPDLKRRIRLSRIRGFMGYAMSDLRSVHEIGLVSR